MTHYAVAWRSGSGSFQSGRLELGRRGLRLEGGRYRTGRLAIRRLLYRDILEAKMASTQDRLSERPTIELRANRGSFYIAPLGAGLTREILRVLQRGMDSDAA